MGRKDTKAVKSISQMYEQMKLESSEILHKTKLLLDIYRDVVWATLHGTDEVHKDVYYFRSEFVGVLVYLEKFAHDTEKEEVEAKVSSLFENKWMIDLIDKAMTRVYDYHNNGRLYHKILSKCYLAAFRYTESEILELLNLERSTFYDRKKEAILLLGISLWGYAIPMVIRGIFLFRRIGRVMGYPIFTDLTLRFVRLLSDQSPIDFLLKVRPCIC